MLRMALADVASIFCSLSLYSHGCILCTDLLCLRFNFACLRDFILSKNTQSVFNAITLAHTLSFLFLLPLIVFLSLAQSKWSHVRLIYFMSAKANTMSHSKCISQFVVCSRWNFSNNVPTRYTFAVLHANIWMWSSIRIPSKLHRIFYEFVWFFKTNVRLCLCEFLSACRETTFNMIFARSINHFK